MTENNAAVSAEETFVPKGAPRTGSSSAAAPKGTLRVAAPGNVAGVVSDEAAASPSIAPSPQGAQRQTAASTAASPVTKKAEKRAVATGQKKGLGTQDLILVAVLLAAGAVLKLTVGSLLASFGMKPNFIIAAYCLAIILIRPNLAQSAAIGLIAGLICQIPMLNATPLLNIPSEFLGALVCGLLIRVPMNIGGKLDINPLVNTFVSTCVSGFTFAALAVYINVVAVGGNFMVAMAAYVAIVLGTATFNCIFVQILAIPLKKVLKR